MSYSKIYLESRTPSELRKIESLSQGPVVTGHKRFDAAVNGPEGYLGTGNASSATQHSSFVRARNKCRCNGRDYEPGVLQDFDLATFWLPANVLGNVRDHAQDKDIILYEIRSPGARRPSHIIHGWIVTDEFHRHIATYPTARPKSEGVMAGIEPYLGWKDHDREDPVPALSLLEATQGFELEDFEDLAHANGFKTAHDSKSCRESRLWFHDEKPFSSWKAENPPDTMTRANTPDRAAALLAIRLNLEPEALVQWRAERVESETPSL